MGSGLYDRLVDDGRLVPHSEVDSAGLATDQVGRDTHKIIQPKPIPFISYPYEWCFSQLKDAALVTLEIQRTALEYGMVLKDANAYNIQFLDGRPVLIDTLSFDEYREGEPWIGYKQLCQHFIAPLALASYSDCRLAQLLRVHLDGLPLDLVSHLLPYKTWLSLRLLMHVHLHARSQQHHADDAAQPDSNRSSARVSQHGMMGLIGDLKSTVERLKWRPAGTEWGSYYESTNYSDAAFDSKKAIVAAHLDDISPAPRMVWDVGANTGVFSRIASDRGHATIASDIDPVAVEADYLAARNREQHILPLLIDLTNPSPGIGWNNRERTAFLDRGPVDVVFALALVHHLAISNNVPLGNIAELFHRMCSWLVIEFVPKSDSQVTRLLATREDIFPDYRQEVFEEQFKCYFEIRSSARVECSERTIYLMRRRA